ncbi:MAG: hypothetical protein BGO98_25980 [Myxococcales bacterium 68-20]|nr:MAG: hypothetical protein BGO98_25980 [Myxococcales bacterium 68-20]
MQRSSWLVASRVRARAPRLALCRVFRRKPGPDDGADAPGGESGSAAAPQEERADGDEDGATERERGARRCTTATGNDPAGTIDAVLIDPNTEIVGKRDRPP